MMRKQSQRGFTLVEMIMVIVITGIIGGMVAVFLKAPIQQYMDVARRAELTDIADTALRRITRDIRTALPNSVRVTGTCDGVGTCFIEFLPTSGGGRYRAGTGGGALCPASPSGEALDFTVPDACFGVLGTMPPMVAGDRLVIYNRGTATPATGSDAYTANTTNDNTGAYSSNTATTVTINPAKLFPFQSPGNRFQVISTPVTYVCAPVTGGVGGTLTRWQGYAIQATQPTTLPGTGTSALLASKVNACSFSYGQRLALVTMNLGITDSDETVTLYNATHVSNVP